MFTPPNFSWVQGVLVPNGPTSNKHILTDANRINIARKQAIKMRKRCELACTDPSKFRKECRNYFMSRRCHVSDIWEANSMLPPKRRISVAEIHAAAEEYHPLKGLNENVTVRIVPKSSGSGLRPIHDFGPAARGAQFGVKALLNMSFSAKPFQHLNKGFAHKIGLAMHYVENGYTNAAELDIASHFHSFELKKLESHLSFPNEITRQVIMASTAERVDPLGQSLSLHKHFGSICSGIPQGSVCSSMVANESVSHLAIPNANDVVLINHADNFFLFAKTSKKLEDSLNTLKSAIQGLPGGSFQAEVVQKTTALDGFRILGCDIILVKGKTYAEPTITNWQNIHGRLSLLLERAIASLNAAEADPCSISRWLAVGDYLKLANTFGGWVKAFEMCPLAVFNLEQQFGHDVAMLKYYYKISKAELDTVNDPSIECGIDIYDY